MSALQKRYDTIKAKYPGALLLFRVNNYYECFSEDAVVISQILNIPLTETKDSKKHAGFEYQKLDQYLPKLVKNGNRVAICDQLEDPREFRRDMYGRTIYPDAYKAYDPSHCWYYHLGGPIHLPACIGTTDNQLIQESDVPKDLVKLGRYREKIQAKLKEDITGYLKAVEKLDPDCIDSCTSVSLKYNHILYNNSILAFLNLHFPKQTTLF